VEQPNNEQEEALLKKGGIYGLRRANIFAYLASLEVDEYEQLYLDDYYRRAGSSRLNIIHGPDGAVAIALNMSH
jgi:hypothetical protein